MKNLNFNTPPGAARPPVLLPGILPASLEVMYFVLDLLERIEFQVCELADTCWDVLDRDERERENTLADDFEEVSYSAGCLCESAEELRDEVDDMLRDVVDDMESRSAQHTAE